MKTQFGFTLVELMITTIVAAIVVTMAGPSFQRLIQDNRLSAQANEVVTALLLARSEALKRSTRVTVCRSANATAVTPGCGGGTGWEDGWVVFVDPNNTGVIDAGERVLRVHETLGGTSTLKGNANVANRVTFFANGAAIGTVGTLVLCDDRGYGDKAKAVVISFAGRVRSVKATDPTSTVASCTP
jgi:prepilin-type N-terminal cleavage/methylation domain